MDRTVRVQLQAPHVQDSLLIVQAPQRVVPAAEQVALVAVVVPVALVALEAGHALVRVGPRGVVVKEKSCNLSRCRATPQQARPYPRVRCWSSAR